MNSFCAEYIDAAIRSEAERVASAAPSSRNDTLNKAPFISQASACPEAKSSIPYDLPRFSAG
jgi:hypothetical protein